MGAVLTILWLASLVVGIIGLIQPRTVRLPSRWVAGALLGFSSFFILFGSEFFPADGEKVEPGVTVAFVFLWSACVGMIWLARKIFRNAKRDAQVKSATIAVDLNYKPPPRPWPSEINASTEEIQAGIEERSRKRRRQNRATPAPGALTPTEKRAMYPTGSADFYDQESHGEWGRIMRRGKPSEPLKFEYADAQGEVTVRTIHKWVEYPEYVEGWCEDREGVRCFKKVRVLEWREGTDKLLRGPKGKARY